MCYGACAMPDDFVLGTRIDRAMIKTNLVGAATEGQGPVEHRAPEVLVLSCDLDTSEAPYTLILIVWDPLCGYHLDLEQGNTMS